MDTTAPTRRDDGALYLGLTFVVLGVIFLLRNFDLIPYIRHWWALFFLIPIAVLGGDVLRHWNREEKLPGARRGPFIGLIVITTVMVVFLLDLNWGVIWPVFIIIGGLAILVTRRT